MILEKGKRDEPIPAHDYTALAQLRTRSSLAAVAGWCDTMCRGCSPRAVDAGVSAVSEPWCGVWFEHAGGKGVSLDVTRRMAALRGGSSMVG
jgi:hypothetical protein